MRAQVRYSALIYIYIYLGFRVQGSFRVEDLGSRVWGFRLVHRPVLVPEQHEQLGFLAFKIEIDTALHWKPLASHSQANSIQIQQSASASRGG